MAGTRREFIGVGVGAVAIAGLGAGFWGDVLGAAGSAARSPRRGYGPRGPANEHGLRLPEGFRSRLIARGGEPVQGTGYRWHEASDGMACFPAADHGWILVSNSETLVGGASAVRFDADGRARSAYRILDGTTQNCSGGGTPWGTWLSCEEVMGGLVWACDPSGERRALSRPAMGTFKHEAAAVDPRGRRIYLTEDLIDGGLYRFAPHEWHDLSSGLLEIATVAPGGAVTWTEVPDPAARRAQTRDQVRGSTRFKRAEGIWHDDGVVYASTKGDHRVHAYDIERERIEVIYDGLGDGPTPLPRADIDRGPITYAEVAEALAFEHPVVRANLSGRELERLAAAVDFVSGPTELDPDRTYSVAASEMLLPTGQPVGTEVEALSRYLER